jgi:glycosyltransferase involved in cell wall biosynthesis
VRSSFVGRHPVADFMRLLWVCGARVFGGAEATTLQLATTLGERGHQVSCLCHAGSEVERQAGSAGLSLRPAAIGGPLNFASLLPIARAIRDFRPDVTLVTTVDEWVWTCLLPADRLGTHLVLVRHMVLPLSRRVQWLANRSAHAVVAVSEAVRRSLDRIDPTRLHVIRVPWRHTPRPAIVSDAERAAARRSLGLPEGGRLIGFFGGLAEEKGLPDALEALRLLQDGTSEALHLFVCGRAGVAADRQRFEGLVARLGLAPRVHLLGWIPDIRPPATAADVVVLPTRGRLGEALPLVLLEAMACGTPVVGTRVGGVPEVIGEDGEAGRLAAPDDPEDLGRVLGEVLADRQGAAAMGERALARLRDHFDPSRAADRYEDLFRKLS